MMVLALVGLVFLPCGLIAQILGLGYFEFEQPAIQLEASVSSMVLIFVLTIVASLTVCLVYVIAARLWRRHRRRDASALSDGIA